jgi:tetratricopeptide (TPR) repeat protein
MLMMWEVLFGRSGAWPAGEGRGKWCTRQLLRIGRHLPFWAVTLAYMIFRKVVVASAFSVGEQVRTVYSHYLTQVKALIFYYLRLALWPVGQNVDREYAVSQSILEVQVFVAIAVLLLAGLVLLRFRRHRNLVFWSLWFPLGLTVTAFLVILIQVVNEHRVYLSLAGLCALAAYLAVRLWESLPLRLWDSELGRQTGRRILAVAIPAVLVALAAGTHIRNGIWSSELSLWEDAAQHKGTYRAHMNYALALDGAGRRDEALAEFQEAVRLGPYAWPHMNLGIAYMKRGRDELGLEHLRIAVRLWPTLPEARRWMAWGLERDGQKEEAETELLKALELRPNYLAALKALAKLYTSMGRPDEALAIHRRLADTDPREAREPDLLFEVAFSQQKQGEREAAIGLYEELLQLAPRHRQGTFNLAYAYMGGAGPDDWARAADLFEKVLEIDPEYLEALHHLASAHWKLGNAQAAVRWDREYLERGAGHRGLERESRRRIASQGETSGAKP